MWLYPYISSPFPWCIQYIFSTWQENRWAMLLLLQLLIMQRGGCCNFPKGSLARFLFISFFVVCLFSQQFTQHLDHESLVNRHLLSLFLGTALNTCLRTFLITEWGAPCDRFIVYYTGVGQVVTTFWVRPASQEIIKIWSRPLDSKYQRRTEFDSHSSERKASQLIS